MKNIKKQKGIILFTSLVIILILSLVVYGGLYNIQVAERTGSAAGTNANKTHQMAELTLLSIESNMFEDKAIITTQCVVSTSESCKFTDTRLRLIDLGVLDTFIAVSTKVSEDAATSIFSHTAYLGNSKDLGIAPGSEYLVYRITVVAVFGDARSVLESIVAIPVI